MSLHIVIDVRHIRDFGIGTYIRNLVAALGRLDPDDRYTLVAHPDDRPLVAQLPRNFAVALYRRPDSDWMDQITFPLFLRNLGGALHHIPLHAVPLAMPKPYVVTIHDMSRLVFGGRRGLREQLTLYRFRRGVLRADRVIAVSEATRSEVEDLLGVPGHRVRRIYSGLDPRFFEHGPAADARAAGPDLHGREMRRILERYQIKQPFLLYAGTIRPQKNIPRLVEAFAVLLGEIEGHPDYSGLKLIIIGDEILKYPPVRRAVIQSRVEHAVRFLGFVPFDTLRFFYEAAEAFVFPSLYEGFGFPPLEAMASGTPVVTSNVSSLPEVVGEAAMIVNPENVFDIARGMREVLLDKELREELRRRGYEQARRFHWEDAARQVLETYREAAAR